jgi:glycosyltransferase involved in cell wall biosynthesis
MTDQFDRLGPLIVFKKIDAKKPHSIKLLHRLENYANEYVSVSPQQHDSLTVQGVHNFSNEFGAINFPNLSILKSSSNTFAEFIRTISHYRERRGYPGVIIAGDPWVGFLKCYLLKRFVFRGSEIQIQFHGDIYSVPKPWKLKELIKYSIVRLSLVSAQSIRVVSDFQIEELKPHVQSDATFVCAPIPLDLEKISTRQNSLRDGIGLIGRLHKERDLDFFVSIVEELNIRRIRIPVLIVGNGPEKKSLVRKLKKLGLLGNVSFLGEMGNSELKILYGNLRVLLTCAPSEGYGLTIREAALSGIQVVARKSKGTISAKQDYDLNIHLYDSISQAVDLIDSVFKDEVKRLVDTPKILLQEKRDLDAIQQWVQTWVV